MIKEINKIFKKPEIKALKGFLYDYIPKKKIVVYVPLEFVDKLMFDMSASGAGLIGNYELCSFRVKGLGTYKPVGGAKPFKGKKNNISYEEEIRLEMECAEKELDAVIDTMLENHPYEEVAYEIYDFRKRSDAFSGYIVELKKSITVRQLISRFHNIKSGKDINSQRKIYKIAVITGKIKTRKITSSEKAGCDAILSLNKNSKILNILKNG